MHVADLYRLSHQEFEAVCLDLFEDLLGMELEPGGPGGDGGIDLRGTTDAGGLLVVQCKHRWRSRGAELAAHIERDELPKIQRLRPERYVLATSAEFDYTTRDRLLRVLAPYGTRRGDVYSGDQLVRKLGERPHIVRKHPTLLHNSAEALRAVVDKVGYEADRDLLAVIARSLELFVPGWTFADALGTLEERHVLLLAGLPGMGKTTLAHAVAADHVPRGYDIVAVTANADDVARAWRDDRPQLFLWDDFLGAPSAGGVPLPSTAPLLRVIERVTEAPDKRLVLTTREYMLARAQRDQERLHNASLAPFKHSLGFDEYYHPVREEIVRRHIAASALAAEAKEDLVAAGVPSVVARQPHFVPDAVATAVRAAAQGLLRSDDLARELPGYVDDPARMWAHVVDNQLEDTAVDLLAVVFAWGGAVPRPAARTAWAALRRHGARPVDERDFDRALHTLEGTMLARRRPGRQVEPTLVMHNDSVDTFLTGYFTTRPATVEALFASAAHFEQVEGLWDVLCASGVVSVAVKEAEDAVAAAVARTIDAAPVEAWTGPLHRTAALAEIADGLGHPALLALLRERLAGMDVEFEPYCDEDEDTALHIVAGTLLRRRRYDAEIEALLLPAVRRVGEYDIDTVYCLTRFVDYFPDLPAPVLEEAERRIRRVIDDGIARVEAGLADDDERWVIERIAALRDIDVPPPAGS